MWVFRNKTRAPSSKALVVAQATYRFCHMKEHIVVQTHSEFGYDWNRKFTRSSAFDGEVKKVPPKHFSLGSCACNITPYSQVTIEEDGCTTQ